MGKAKRLITILTAILLFSGGVANATEKPVISIAGIDHYRPYSYMENGHPEGLYNEIVRELFRRSGYPVKITLMPFKRILSMTESGEVAGMAGTFLTPDRKKFAVFLEKYPLAEIATHIFVRRDGSISSPELDELKGKVIGHKRGFIISPELDNAVARGDFTLYETESVEQLVKMLLINRLDGFFHSKYETLYYVEKFHGKNIVKLLMPPVSDARKTYLAFSRQQLKTLPENFVTNIRKSFENIIKDGTLDKIYAKYKITCQ